jgi:hypothetical protein
MRRVRGMPVPCRDYRRAGTLKLGDQTIENSNNLVASRHRERAAGAKIVLHIDNDQGISRHRKSL